MPSNEYPWNFRGPIPAHLVPILKVDMADFQTKKPGGRTKNTEQKASWTLIQPHQKLILKGSTK